MLFQSLDFAVFLPIALAGYWLLRRSVPLQNAWLAIASAVFYAWWSWRFLVLMTLAALVAYAAARSIARRPEGRERTVPLATGIALLLGVLAYFKYANFFMGTLRDAFSFIGRPIDMTPLRLVLPIGISFYTFRAISYMVDVARDDVEARRSVIPVFVFVGFFPYLLAGPVERSKLFLPQLDRPRSLSAADACDALHLILWGLFKKIVIADALAPSVDYVFVNHGDLARRWLFLGLVYYALQLYADFSGYSDIAVGVAKLFGLSITRNFALPYFARSIAEFWRRWHISLYEWFNDYVYGPLSTAWRDWGTAGAVAALLVTFSLSGLWHGAEWTFVIWGVLHGTYLSVYLVWRTARRGPARRGTASGMLPWIATLTCVLFAYVFFRSPTVPDALSFLHDLAVGHAAATSSLHLERLGWVAALPAYEWLQRHRRHPMEVGDWHYTVRFPLYGALCLAIFLSIRVTDTTAFIYFKF